MPYCRCRAADGTVALLNCEGHVLGVIGYFIYTAAQNADLMYSTQTQ
jgi:hypothetical protein